MWLLVGGRHDPSAELQEGAEGRARAAGEALFRSGRLLPGGKDAFEQRVGELGYPVVANVWASWCGPCRFEFPIFQQTSAKLGKKVAFLGIDSEDSEKEAAKWLKDHPVPYPTYFEIHAEIAASLKLTGRPDTVFYNAKGEHVYTKVGPYSHVSELEADIKKYALGGA